MLAVITLNYNLHKHTIDCVNSILASDYSNFNVYLVDNGSEQADFKLLCKAFNYTYKVKILRINSNVGYVRGVNFGIETAQIDNPSWYLIMNNDTVIDKYAIGYLVDTAVRYDNRAIVSGKVYYYDHPDILQHTGVIFKDHRYMTTYYPCKNEKDTGQCDEEAERDSLDDVFWLLPVQLVKDVGFYCDYFFLYAEQGDYAQRARRKGYKLIYTPQAKIWHKESMTTGAGNAKALPVYYYRGQGRFIFQYRNLKTRYFIVITIWNITTLLVKTLITKGYQRKCTVAICRGYLWGLKWMFNKKPNDGYNPYLNKN